MATACTPHTPPAVNHAAGQFWKRSKLVVTLTIMCVKKKNYLIIISGICRCHSMLLIFIYGDYILLRTTVVRAVSNAAPLD